MAHRPFHKIWRTAISIALSLSLFSCLQAQEPVLTLRAPSSVAAGEAFEISYAINVRGSKNFQAPAFKGLDVLFGPMQSQSSSFQFVNGKQSQSFSLSYTYQLRAPKEGNYTFGAASIVVDGKTYVSEPLKLTVTAARQNPQQNAQTPQRQQTRPAANTPPAEVSDKDLFVTSTVNKRTPYVGEQVLLSYRIYTAIPVEQYSIYKTPSSMGFWTEELKANTNSQEQEVIDNRLFVYADMRKVAIFAQDAGPHTIEPMEVEAIAQVQAPRRRSNSIFDIFDDAFFNPTESVKKSLRTKPLKINVKELPQEGRPASFDGLVGNYSILFNYDRNQPVRTNEALTFTFTVKGSGNIEMIHAPQIQFPPDFEVYEPKISYDKQLSASGVSGKASFEYIVIPRNPGVYKINAFRYSFFNPQTEKYEETLIPETVLNVEKGKDLPTDMTSLRSQDTPKNDIEYIRIKADRWQKSGHSLLFSLHFWLILLGEAILFISFLLFYRQHLKRNADLAGIRNRHAARQAKKCLKKAKKLLDEQHRDAFYMEISQALWGFLRDKLNIPTADLALDTVRAALQQKNIETLLIEQFLLTLEHCEFARFSRGVSDWDKKSMQDLYDEAEDIIRKIIGTLK